MQMKKSVRNLIMSWVGWGGLGWAGMGWGGLGWVGDGLGWAGVGWYEAILYISQGFKEGRR